MPAGIALLDMSAECGGAAQLDGAHRAALGTTEGVGMGLPVVRAAAITRKKKTMDISQSLENAGIGSLRSVHQIGRKNGHNDRQSVHLPPQVSQLISSGDRPDLARLQGQDATATQRGQFLAQAEHLTQ